MKVAPWLFGNTVSVTKVHLSAECKKTIPGVY